MNEPANSLSSWSANFLRPAFLFGLLFMACNLPGLAGTPPVQPTETPRISPAPPPVNTNLPPTSIPLPAEPADFILYNAFVLTINPAQPQARAIAVREGRIQAVGDEAEVMALAGPDTRLIDLQNSAVLPGFVDTHSHLFGGDFQDLAGGQDAAISVGITTLAEMSVVPAGLEAIYAAEAAGALRMRISVYPVLIDNCGNPLGFWFENYPPSLPPGAKLQLPGVKIFTDGGSCNSPAVSYEYPGGIGHGDLYFTSEELAALLVEAQSRGYQAAIHAIVDRAIEMTQEAISQALAGGPNTFRHRIDHNAVLPAELMPRYQQIGIFPQIFGKFPACYWRGDTSQFKYVTPEEYREYEWPWRALLDANPGVHFGWHGDYPVFGSLAPLDHLFGFVTRAEWAPDGTLCEPPDWAANDAITVEEALEIMTLGSAYALFRESEIGSLEPGKLADLVIMTDNPLLIDPLDFRNIKIMATVVGGETVFCAEGEEAYCPC